MRTFASVSARALGGEEELLTLTLTLAPSYRALASVKGGLSATVELSFTAPGQPTLTQTLAVAFTNTEQKAKPHTAARRHARATSEPRRGERR